MSRYIDADALIQLGLQDGAYEYVSVQEIADFPTADVVEKEKWDRLLENSIILADAVQKYQLADVVEVVRCKDCENMDTNCTFSTIDTKNTYYCAVLDDVFYEDFFCALGERRKNEV